jgi:hypothetical protein
MISSTTLTASAPPEPGPPTGCGLSTLDPPLMTSNSASVSTAQIAHHLLLGLAKRAPDVRKPLCGQLQARAVS